MRCCAFYRLLIVLLICSTGLPVLAQMATGFGTDQAPWMQVSNQMSVSIEHYSVRGIDGRQLPFTYILNGSPTLQIGETPVPFSFTFSSFQNSYQTPFNQMGTSPKYKWIQAHVGYRNLSFSNFTLGGQRMLGAGVELTPGRWQFGFFWGVIRRAIAPDSLNTDMPPPGSLFFGPGYRRSGYGAKIGFGKKDESNITLSMFRGKDHVQSIDEDLRSLVRKPEVNMVLGLAWRVRFSEKLAWVHDMAISAYTRNSVADSLDLSDVPYAETIGRIFMPMETSQYLSAIETGLQYQTKKFKASVKYRRIDPDFKSMGIYFINSDLQEYTFNPTWRMSKKVTVSGSVGYQQDNLRDIKQRTTERIIYRGQLDWTPNDKFGLGLNHSNFGITQNALAPNIADTTLLRQVNTTYGIQPRYTLRNDRVVQVFMVNATYQELSNAFSGAFAPPDVNTAQVTGVYSWNLIKHALSINPSITYVEVASSLFSTRSTGGAVSVSSPLRVVPVNGTVQSAVYLNTVDGVRGGSTISLSVQLNYKLKNGMAFQGGAQYLHNSGSVSQTLPEFTEVRLRAGFTWAISRSIKKKEKE
jgi:hypothetical protein